MDDEYAEVSIRRAGSQDARAIAAVNVASWRVAYAGIVADEFLASLDVEQRTEIFAEFLGDRHPSSTWVAVGDGRTLGFVTVGPSRDEDAEPGDREIYAIYLDPEAWGRGVARDLMRTVVGSGTDGSAVTLWAIADNERAQHFYRRHGFAADGVEKREEIGGRDLTQRRFRRD
ncbi:GNAT family N-acetyltransferase [Cellulomonas sp. PhB143]|uniref:GNAT family N-acetyltransferase n=1 Tax=Cellulomonas sp. PhB143 TaxID=2485186 RepID=UPI000F4759ED|nr:N-acetyltransferase [Cellulomonas sp. PhB143]ROS73562.1 ribosomal protein S18 acetylase RimI-like enzyme [Cellulomonas sp. PhB143]